MNQCARTFICNLNDVNVEDMHEKRFLYRKCPMIRDNQNQIEFLISIAINFNQLT